MRFTAPAPARLGTRLELRDDARDGSRQEGVVRVQPAEDRAAGASEAVVQRLDLARAGQLLDRGEAVGVATGDLDAPVGRPAVDDDVLDRRVVLTEHGFDRLG